MIYDNNRWKAEIKEIPARYVLKIVRVFAGFVTRKEIAFEMHLKGGNQYLPIIVRKKKEKADLWNVIHLLLNPVEHLTV